MHRAPLVTARVRVSCLRNALATFKRTAIDAFFRIQERIPELVRGYEVVAGPPRVQCRFPFRELFPHRVKIVSCLLRVSRCTPQSARIGATYDAGMHKYAGNEREQ